MGIDKIAQSLGVEPLEDALKNEENQEERSLIEIFDPEVEEATSTAVALSPGTDLAEELAKDLELAQNNVKKIVEQGANAFAELITIAKQSESPRAFEVAATLMTAVVAANKEFVDLAEKKRMSKEEADPVQQNITNNNLIISTSDLLSHILEKKKENK